MEAELASEAVGPHAGEGGHYAVPGAVGGGGEGKKGFFGLANVDFEGGGAFEPAQPGPSGKRRGRPRGSRGRTTEDNTPITPGDMAFLRAWVQGISPERAAAQYLGPGLARHRDAVQLYTRGLFRRIYTSQLSGGLDPRALLMELNAPLSDGASAAPALPAATGKAAFPAALPAVRQTPPASPAPPPLEEWLVDHPELEDFSYDEQLEAYREAFEYADMASAGEQQNAEQPVPVAAGPVAALPALVSDGGEAVGLAQARDLVLADQAAANESRVMALRRKLEAINTLSGAIVTAPTGEAPLQNWITKPLAEALRAELGLKTLAQLVTWINQRGRHWYDEVPRLGRDRAHRLLSWLTVHREHIGVDLVPRVLVGVLRPEVPPDTGLADRPPTPLQLEGEGAARRALALVPARSMFSDLVLTGEGWSLDLCGADGVFRQKAAPNTTGATSDIEALREYDRVYLAAQAPGTREVYRRALERLVFWALRERSKPISSLTTDDFAAFKGFLGNPPGHWINRFPVLRTSPDWRPFRGKLGESSVRQQMAIVASFMARLFRTGYLTADACAFVPQVKGGRQVLDAGRSFSDGQLEVVRRTFEQLPGGPWKNRLRAAILLLQTTGLRLAEAVATDFEKLVARVDAETGDVEAYEFAFEGKGKKARVVFVPVEAYEALTRHYADRYALTHSRTDQRGRVCAPELPARYARSPIPTGPVLGVIQRLRNVGRAGPGDATSDVVRKDNEDGRLAARSVHSMLAAFFAKCELHAGAAADMVAFGEASAHWLRHTFAKDALKASGNQLASVQQLLGHASISTTGVYLRANTDDRFAAVKSIRRSL